MKNALLVKASLNGEEGNSSKIASQFIEKLSEKVELRVDELNLASDNLPHLTQQEMAAWGIAEEARTEQQAELASISDKYISRLKQADYIVLAVPMYNFDSPSVVKAYFDRLARAGVTFRYTENGPEGLITGKKVFVLFARGGKYQGSDLDTQTPYIKNFLAFLGMKDVETAYAEGLAMGPESAEEAFSQFNEKISELISNIDD